MKDALAPKTAPFIGRAARVGAYLADSANRDIVEKLGATLLLSGRWTAEARGISEAARKDEATLEKLLAEAKDDARKAYLTVVIGQIKRSRFHTNSCRLITLAFETYVAATAK